MVKTTLVRGEEEGEGEGEIINVWFSSIIKKCLNSFDHDCRSNDYPTPLLDEMPVF